MCVCVDCFASSRLVWVAKASTMSLSMAVKAGKKCALVVVTMAVWFLVPYPQSGECAFGIQINPCTLSHCVAECKKDLQEKYQSQPALGPKGSSVSAWVERERLLQYMNEVLLCCS